jgi:uncharacterized repeat protein (TIGR01451 family)
MHKGGEKKLKTKITLITLTFFIILTLSGTVTAGESDLNSTDVVLEETNLRSINETPTNYGLDGNSEGFPDPYNTRTMESFTTIQEAISDSDTMNGDTIWVQPGTYNEHVIVNKQLTIIPWPSLPGTVTINAGGTGSCIRITSTGSGSTIQGFILTGATQSSTAGVYLDNNANNCNILQNTMVNNWAGMFVWSSFNQIYENIIIDNNRHGIRLVSGSGYNNIYSNIIKNNNLNHASGDYGGITTSGAATGNDNIYLNQIVGNYGYQVYGQAHNSLTANNNWWGTNSGPIGITGVVCNTWLILGIVADPYSIYNGQTSTVTADLNHNNNLEDVSTLGHVKDGIPVSFIFTGVPLGTLNINPAYTLNGNATTNFTANAAGTSQINATLDYSNVHTASNAAHTPCDIVITPASAHVTLTKTIDKPTPNYWDVVTFHIIAHNNGPTDAEGVQVTDLLPSGLIYVSCNPSGTTTYDPVTGIWNILTLTFGGADATLDIVANITSTGTITNWANVTAQTTHDFLPFNSTSLTLDVPEAAVLELTKTVSNSNPVVHDTILYTLIVQNHGPDAATSVNVTDVLPLGGLNFVGVDSVDYGSYANGVWSIPHLPAQTVAHLVLRFTVERAGTIENRANITSLTWDPELYPHNVTMTINAQDSPTTANAQTLEKTVGMEKTGIPISTAILALLMIFSSLIYVKRE